MELEGPILSLFFPLLQGGIVVNALVGRSIQDFLCSQVGLDPGYVRERILSIVLEGKPVDDLETAILWDGATLALSSGMPGLVGATLRRGSILAAFRGSITHKESSACGREEQGLIRLKLFNLMLKELGPRFLERGILMDAGTFDGFMKDKGERLRERCRSAAVNGTSIEAASIGPGMAGEAREVLVSVVMR